MQLSAAEPADEDRPEVSAPPHFLPASTGSVDQWSAVQDAAVAAAEAVAAAAAAEVAFEAASTARAAVVVASAAAAKAARRARAVAAAAAEVVAATAAVQQGESGISQAEGASPRTSRDGSSVGPTQGAQSPGLSRAAAAQAAEAQRVAHQVERVAAAAATAAVDAARVVAAQLHEDVEAVAAYVAAVYTPNGDPEVALSRAAHMRAKEITLGSTAAQTAASASHVEADATLIRTMTVTGASQHTIAAVLNARGSRTAQRRRWTAGTVAKVVHPHLLVVGLAADRPEGSVSDGEALVPAQGARALGQQTPDAAQQFGGSGIWNWDITTDEVAWSEQMYRLFGTDEKKFVATYEGFLSCVHADDREHVSASVALAFAGALTCEFDYRVCHQNGDELWLRTQATAVLDDDGTPVAMQGTVSDITAAMLAELHEQQQAKDLVRLTWYDSLTGLGNRSLLRERLSHALLRHAKTLRVLLLGLDDFAAVNVTVGHLAADQLLADVATRLLHNARGGDTVARLGGDTFAIIMESGDPDELAARVLDALATPALIGDRTVTLRASIGIATPSGSFGVDELLVQAEVAMFAAKAAAKGTVLHFHTPMSDAVRRRAELVDGLRHAVSNGEIVVQYQPIVNVATQLVSRVEALVRWQRPDGLIPPADFLPLAEETGLIVGIGHEVLQQACERVRSWLASDPARSVAVNVSPLQLLADDFADSALAILNDAHVDPHQVILEVTETLFLRTTPSLIEQLDRLRASGLRIAIDDFGTGYSSLGRLHSLPIDSIKIDKSFVDLIHTDDEPQPIISSMIAMARELHLDVTAEGVETAEQAVRLVELGCDHLQGFYFARPAAGDTAIGSDSDAALTEWSKLLSTKITK